MLGPPRTPMLLILATCALGFRSTIGAETPERFRLQDAVVRIGGCSGVCVDPVGIVLTAKHCGLGERETVTFPGREPVEGVRIHVGPQAEDAVAFLVSGERWPFIPVAEAVPPAGADVWSGGYPGASQRTFRTARGRLIGGGEHELRRGHESLGRFLANETTLVTGPGWSGGPLVTEEGRTVGLLSAGNATGSTFISWAATRRAYEAARETRQSREKPHLLVFGFNGCRHCETFLADLAAGRFTAYDVEYVDVQTPAGRKRYEDLRLALEKATGSVPPRGFPAFHVAGRAAMTVGYSTGSGRRLLDWIRETLRLPVTGFDTITGRTDPGISPDPGPPSDSVEETPGTPPVGPTSTLPTGTPPGDEEPLPWWAMLAGAALRILEERLTRDREPRDGVEDEERDERKENFA